MLIKILFIVIALWLFFKVFGLMLRIAWGFTKIIASVLLVLSLPALVLGAVFAGGFVLLIPIAMIAAAFGILKSCV